MDDRHTVPHPDSGPNEGEGRRRRGVKIGERREKDKGLNSRKGKGVEWRGGMTWQRLRRRRNKRLHAAGEGKKFTLGSQCGMGSMGTVEVAVAGRGCELLSTLICARRRVGKVGMYLQLQWIRRLRFRNG